MNYLPRFGVSMESTKTVLLRVAHSRSCLALLGFGAVLLVWWIVADTPWGKNHRQVLWLAHPRDVFGSLSHLSTEGWWSIVASTVRIVFAFVIVFAIGLPAGLLLGLAAPLFRLLEGPLDFWRSIPPVAVLPVCFFLFPGTGNRWFLGMLESGDAARIACVMFGCVPIVMFSIADAVRSVPRGRTEFAEQNQASSWFTARWLLLYELLPSIFQSLRVVVSFSVVIVVACEMAWGAGLGIGDRINGTRYADDGLSSSYAYAMVAGLLGYAANVVIGFLDRRTIWWN